MARTSKSAAADARKPRRLSVKKETLKELAAPRDRDVKGGTLYYYYYNYRNPTGACASIASASVSSSSLSGHGTSG